MTHQKKKRNECTIYIMRKHIGLLKAYCSYRLFILDAHIFYSNIKRSSKLCLSAKEAKEKCNILPDDDDSRHWQSSSATLNILRDILEHMISIFVLIPNIEKMQEWVYVLYRLAKWNTNRIEKWSKSPSKKNAKPNIRENKNDVQINTHIKKWSKKSAFISFFFVFASIKKPSNTFCQWTLNNALCIVKFLNGFENRLKVN